MVDFLVALRPDVRLRIDDGSSMVRMEFFGQVLMRVRAQQRCSMLWEAFGNAWQCCTLLKVYTVTLATVECRPLPKQEWRTEKVARHPRVQ